MAHQGSSIEKSDRAFRTISEAAEVIGVPQHVLRFWETRFTQLQPLKRGGNRRYYRPTDMALLETIRAMLHDEGLTIRGAQLALANGKDRARASDTVLATVAALPIAALPVHAPTPPTLVHTLLTAGIDIAPLRDIRDRLRLALAA